MGFTGFQLSLFWRKQECVLESRIPKFPVFEDALGGTWESYHAGSRCRIVARVEHQLMSLSNE